MKKRTLFIIMALIMLISACAKPVVAPTAFELLDLGEKYLLELNYEQALVQFLAVIDVEPMKPRGYTGAAEAYFGLGDMDAAKIILEQGQAEIGGDESIQNMLDEIYREEEARRQAEMATEEARRQAEELADYIVEWVDTEFERMIRIGLNKPSGDIWRSELDGVFSIAILGSTHCFINDEGYDWSYRHITLAGDENYGLSAFYGIGAHDDGSVNEEYTGKGSVSSLADIVNFTNIDSLAVIANQLSDLSPLLELPNPDDIYCTFFANNIADTAMLNRYCDETINEQFVEIGDSLPTQEYTEE